MENKLCDECMCVCVHVCVGGGHRGTWDTRRLKVVLVGADGDVE